jgi:hypothetical protein
MTLSCLCGAAAITIARRPDFIFECNCTLCRKTGARWAYFPPEEIAPTGLTRSYHRADKPDPSARIHFCPTCGATTHFTLTASAVARHGNTMAGVNMALTDEASLAGIELRYPDGASWTGEGAFAFVREPRVL